MTLTEYFLLGAFLMAIGYIDYRLFLGRRFSSANDGSVRSRATRHRRHTTSAPWMRRK
ncbi:MAG TPA: hypothetical protein VJ719_11900 [Chthoniobacterales bacterium]|nr:hypothetical protein [Chthoniobacterales bacterium]